MTVQTLPGARTRIGRPVRMATRHGTGDILQRAEPRPGRSVRRGTSGGAEDLIHRNGRAARLACEHMTWPALNAVRDTVAWASSLPARPNWDRKAAAHAELFRLLAGLAGDRVAAVGPGGQAGLLEDLMCAVGPAADGMIMSSRRRLVAYLSAGDADNAAREVETHLRVLLYMGRLATTTAAATDH
jgi:DNA-binding FadR family transcriptional regulator